MSFIRYFLHFHFSNNFIHSFLPTCLFHSAPPISSFIFSSHSHFVLPIHYFVSLIFHLQFLLSSSYLTLTKSFPFITFFRAITRQSNHSRHSLCLLSKWCALTTDSSTTITASMDLCSSICDAWVRTTLLHEYYLSTLLCERDETRSLKVGLSLSYIERVLYCYLITSHKHEQYSSRPISLSLPLTYTDTCTHTHQTRPAPKNR